MPTDYERYYECNHDSRLSPSSSSFAVERYNSGEAINIMYMFQMAKLACNDIYIGDNVTSSYYALYGTSGYTKNLHIGNNANLSYLCGSDGTRLELNGRITIGSDVTNCNCAFHNSYYINPRIVDIGFDTRGYRNVDATGMFERCRYLNTNIIIPEQFNITARMFADCANFNSNVIFRNMYSGPDNMYGMFRNCTSFDKYFTLPQTNVTNVSSMFEGCTKLNRTITLSGSVTNATNMFRNCTNLNRLAYTVSYTFNPLNAAQMFYDCPKMVCDMEIPNTVYNAAYMFGVSTPISACNGFTLTIWNTSMAKTSITGIVKNRNFNGGSKMTIICPNLAVINGNNSTNSVTGTGITWSAVSGYTGTYRNTRYNIWISNQYYQTT